MSKFPVEISDSEGIIDGLNYLLSGPSGLGQNFGGVSFNGASYLLGTSTDPYMSSTARQLQSDIISIDTGSFLDAHTLQINFTGAPLGFVPFDNSDSVYVFGTSEANVHGYYNVGVIECTEDYVILRDPTAFTPTPDPFTGGTIFKTVTYSTYLPDVTEAWIPTDCNSFATVTGETDRVFIGGQIDFGIEYLITSGGPYTLDVVISVNRYKAIPGEPITNPKINFMFDGIVTDTGYSFSDLTTSGTIPFQIGPVFVSVIDNPGPGYYWYVIEVQFTRTGGSNFYVTYFLTDKRSLSTQVVKQ